MPESECYRQWSRLPLHLDGKLKIVVLCLSDTEKDAGCRYGLL